MQGAISGCKCSHTRFADRVRPHCPVQHQRSFQSFQGGRRCRSAALDTTVMKTSTTKAVPLPVLPLLDGSYEAACTFSDVSNWLIPGHLMLGRYPFVEPSRCLAREKGEEQIEALLDAGIDTFVSLQAELPPQVEMPIRGISGFLPYKATADLMMAAKGGPPPMAIVEGLRNPQLNKYLPPKRGAASQKTEEWGHKEVTYVHFPIEDLSVPNVDKVQGLLEDLELRILAGNKLYVHCWGGRGRAGTIGALLLASMYGVSAEEALIRVQRSFDTRKDGGRRSPETDQQIEFIRDFIGRSASVSGSV